MYFLIQSLMHSLMHAFIRRHNTHALCPRYTYDSTDDHTVSQLQAFAHAGPHFWHTDPCSLLVDSLLLILQCSALSLLLFSPGPPSLQSPHSGLFGVGTGLHLKLDVSPRRAASGTTAAPAPLSTERNPVGVSAGLPGGIKLPENCLHTCLI